MEEEQEEGGAKRLKPFEGDEEPTQPDEEAFAAAVEPTLIVTEDRGDDEGPTQIIEEVVEEVETTQMVVETLEAVLAGYPQRSSRCTVYSGAPVLTPALLRSFPIRCRRSRGRS